MKMSNSPTSKKDIGARIREYRTEAKLSQQDLADELGYKSGTAISLIESGARGIDAEDLPKVAKVLHVSVSMLMGEDTKTPNFSVALRADGELDEKDKREILNFYNYVKDRKKR